MEFDAESQYFEVAVNGGMDTLLNIDDRQLFVCDVNYKIIDEEYIKESNEGADKRHVEHCQKMQVCKKVARTLLQPRDGEDADQGEVD